jgi:hypothetical protein
MTGILGPGAQTLRSIPTNMFQNQQNSARGAPLSANRLQNGKLGKGILKAAATGQRLTQGHVQVTVHNGDLEVPWVALWAFQMHSREQTAAACQALHRQSAPLRLKTH